MADINALADLIRQQAFLQSGGKPQYATDKLNKAFGTLGQAGDEMTKLSKEHTDIIKNVLEAKASEQKNKAMFPMQVPLSPEDSAAQNADYQKKVAQANQENVNLEPNRQQYLKQRADQLENQTGLSTLGDLGVPRAPVSPDMAYQDIGEQGLQNVGLGRTPIPEAPSPTKTQMLTAEQYEQAASAGLKGAQANFFTSGGKSLPVSALPLEAKQRALAAGLKETDLIPVEKFNALKATDASANVPVIPAEQALQQGKVPGNAKVLMPAQMSSYANMRGKEFIMNSLPSRESNGTVPGAASQVQFAAHQLKQLIANPGSPQRLGLSNADLARMITRAAPQEESLKNANFSDTLTNRLGQLMQKITADPASLDTPEMRHELYNIADEMDQSAKPLIARELSNAEKVWGDYLPPKAEWEKMKADEMGYNLPKIPFNDGSVQPAQAQPAQPQQPVQPPTQPQVNAPANQPRTPGAIPAFNDALTQADAAIQQGKDKTKVKNRLFATYPNMIAQINQRYK